MARILKITFTMLLFMVSMSGFAQIVTIFNMQYIDGTPIPLGGTIEIEEGGESRIQFAILIEQMNGSGGTLKVLTEIFQGAPPLEWTSETIFSGGTTHLTSADITLEAGMFNASGGILYAQFKYLPFGVAYNSGNYNIVVVPGNNDCTLSAPSNKTTSNITPNSATVGWTPVSGASGYHSQYKPTNSSTWTTINNGSSSTSHNISGLTPSTSYEWRVRSRCSNGEYGEWSNNVPFTTPAACGLPAPNGLMTTNITDTSARLDWNPVSSAVAYQVQLQDFPTGSFSTVAGNISGTTYNLNNLSPQTTYRWRVRARCNNGFYSGNYGTSLIFTTQQVCPQNQNKTEEVLDGEVDIDDSELTLNASNIIFDGGIAEYDTGTTLLLKPGFHAQPGSDFWAYIEGCTPTLKSSETNEEAIIDRWKEVKLSPNPTRGSFVVRSDDKMSDWALSNQFGNLHKQGHFHKDSSKELELNISEYPTGIYFLRIEFADGEIVTKTIIKE